MVTEKVKAMATEEINRRLETAAVLMQKMEDLHKEQLVMIVEVEKAMNQRRIQARRNLEDTKLESNQAMRMLQEELTARAVHGYPKKTSTHIG